MVTRRQFVHAVAFGTLACAASAQAQQLAHAGWRGNGMAPESWWKHAVFVQFPQDTTFAAVTAALDSMAQINADSILLPDLRPTDSSPFAASFGTEDDLDTLLREAGARRMHVLITMPLPRATRNPGEVRFWLNRGIAGLALGTVAPADMDAARALRAVLDRSTGDRILLARTQATAEAQPRRGRNAAFRDPITIHVCSVQDLDTTPATANTGVELAGAAPNETSTSSAAEPMPGTMPQLAQVLPLLLAPGPPVLDSRMLASVRFRDNVRDILTLRATHAIVRTGATYPLPTNQPGLHAWLIKGRTAKDCVLIASNTGQAPAVLQLVTAIAAHGVRGSYLLSLLRSDGGIGAFQLNGGSLPAGAAIVGEIRSA